MCSQCAWLDSWGESLGCLPFCPAGWRTLCCVLLLLGAREGGPRGLQRSPSEVTMLESSREKETKQGWDWHPVSLKYFIWSVTKWSGGDSFRYKFMVCFEWMCKYGLHGWSRLPSSWPSQHDSLSNTEDTLQSDSSTNTEQKTQTLLKQMSQSRRS